MSKSAQLARYQWIINNILRKSFAPSAISHKLPKQLVQVFSTIMDIPPTDDFPPAGGVHRSTCTQDDTPLFDLYHLSDLYRRLAVFHNLIGAVYYHKSQYGHAVQHFRRGVELLIEEDRQFELYEADQEGVDNELVIKCTEMEDKMEALRSKHDRMIRGTIHHPRHNPTIPLPTRMKEKVGLIVPREPPIFIDGRGSFHFLHTDGTYSIPSSATNDSSSHLATSIISSVIIHNLALCHSSVGNYRKAMELNEMSRELIRVTSIEIGVCDTLLLVKSLNQLERRLAEESVASVLSEVNDRSRDAAPSA